MQTIRLSPHKYGNLCQDCVATAVLSSDHLEVSAPRQAPVGFMYMNPIPTEQEIDEMKRTKYAKSCEWCGVSKFYLYCYQDVEFHDTRDGKDFLFWIPIRKKKKSPGTVYACPDCI